MVSSINMVMGAILGVVLADSPVFHVVNFGDMLPACLFVIMVIAQAINISASGHAIHVRSVALTVVSCGIFLVFQMSILLIFALGLYVLPQQQEAVVLKFTGISYVWVLLLITTAWFGSNILANVASIVFQSDWFRS